MPRVQPLAREALAEFEPYFEMIEQNMGFVPNSMLTLGRKPDVLRAFADLTSQVMLAGDLPRELKQLVAFVASHAAGCRYCQAHTSHTAHAIGVPGEKIEAALEFETSDLFDDRERAALRIARDAAFVPNATTDEQFEDLHRYFDDDAIVEIVAVISMFGWLNRWNDTLATQLEQSPRAFAEKQLGGRGWDVGRHV